MYKINMSTVTKLNSTGSFEIIDGDYFLIILD